jgi:hypothetical protein
MRDEFGYWSLGSHFLAWLICAITDNGPYAYFRLMKEFSMLNDL